MSLTFKQALDKDIEKNTYVGMYIHLCSVLQESGASKNEVSKYFDKYMPPEEYEKKERNEMVDYLFKISKPLTE